MLNLKPLFFVAPFLLLGCAELPEASKMIPVKIAEVPGYCEGIVFDQQGNGYISDTQHGTIYKIILPEGKTELWATTQAPNGHKILPNGTHLVADKNAVLHLGSDGKLLGNASVESEGIPLRSPNDISLDLKNGGFYFSDPGGSNAGNPIGTLHYVDSTGKTTLVASGFAFPNGVVLRPDGKTLLMGESEFNRIWEFEVLAPGKVGMKKLFADLPKKSKPEQINNAPDGMCLDADGNLFVAHYGMQTVQVFDKTGKLLRSYSGGNLTTSNVAFSGKEMNELYITGAIGEERTTKGCLFRLTLPGVKGLKIINN